MAEQELKRLGRSELIDIIYELQKREEEQLTYTKKLKKKLSEREIKIAESGSIAEAALALNGVFETAQEAADQYLESIRAAHCDMEKKIAQTDADCKAAIEEAEKKAEQIVQEAENKKAQILEQTDKAVAERWNEFCEKAEALIQSHAELKTLLEQNIS